MKVTDVQIQATEPVRTTEAKADDARTERVRDRVSVDAQAERMVQNVQSNLSSNRSARLKEVESAIKRGTYTPNAQRIAEQILQAAEIEARLRALF
jgi:negative regulator of flagellin synthesis FlgM